MEIRGAEVASRLQFWPIRNSYCSPGHADKASVSHGLDGAVDVNSSQAGRITDLLLRHRTFKTPVVY